MIYKAKEDFKDQIQTIVNTLQCVTLRQLYHIIPNKAGRTKEQLENMVFTTYKYHLINRSQGATPEDNIYYTFSTDNIDYSNILCAWVFIDYVKKHGLDPYETLQSACASPKPVSLNIIGNGKLIKFIGIENKSDLSGILLEQERFYNDYEKGCEEESGIQYIIVIEDESILLALENLNISIPHIVALVSYEDSEGIVEYFE